VKRQTTKAQRLKEEIGKMESLRKKKRKKSKHNNPERKS